MTNQRKFRKIQHTTYINGDCRRKQLGTAAPSGDAQATLTANARTNVKTTDMVTPKQNKPRKFESPS